MRPLPRSRYARLLQGSGLEIGALARPTAVPEGVSVTYADFLDPAYIAAHYPGAPIPAIRANAESLPGVADSAFDFVIANHVLEHLTDPIGALVEWHRVVRDGGLVLLAVPDKRYTFDAARRRTTLSHNIDDHRSPLPPGLKNFQHLVEWATYVERLERFSPEWGRFIEEQFASSYVVHNHVWVCQDVLALVAHLYRGGTAPFGLVRWSNTGLLGDEFTLLLRVRRAPRPAVRARDRTHLVLAMLLARAQTPLQRLLARCKHLLRARRAR